MTEPLYDTTDAPELVEMDGIIPLGLVTKLSGDLEHLTRHITYGETLILVVEVEATNVGLNKKQKRVQSLTVTDAYDLAEVDDVDAQALLRQARSAYRLANVDPDRPGFDDTRQPVVSADGVVLTAREIAEARGDTLPEDEIIVVEFVDGARGTWPDDWVGLGQTLAAVGGTMRRPGSTDFDDVGKVLRWLSPAKLEAGADAVLAEWTGVDEDAYLAELEAAAAAEEAKADREVVEGMERPASLAEELQETIDGPVAAAKSRAKKKAPVDA